MTRLPFVLEEWQPRISWVSPEAQRVWEPRLHTVARGHASAERLLVAKGHRRSTLQFVTPDDLVTLFQETASLGLQTVILGKIAAGDEFQALVRLPKDGEPWVYRVAITTPADAAAWTHVTLTDSDAVGRLLGYPACCRKHFVRVWDRERWIDPTSQMGESGTPGLNLLWRWFGIRPVSHLPCDTGCEASRAQAAQLTEVLPEPARTWHTEMLRWPVEWSSLHGIAEILTPVFRATVMTDALAQKAVRRYAGTAYPKEGAAGVRFPYRPTAPTADVRHVFNGFLTPDAMRAAHQRILAPLANRPFHTVVDLGCGDGSLLAQVNAIRRVGIEADPSRARRAERVLDRVIRGDCADRALLARVFREEQPSLVIAQAVRNPPETLMGLRVLSYSYDDAATVPQVLEVDRAACERPVAERQ